MNYLKSYIEGSIEEKSPGGEVCYLLPGLINKHTGAGLSGDELLECKKEYNEWLSHFRSRRAQFEAGQIAEADRATKISHMEFWLSQMYECLRKIGQYTHEEMMEGFKL